MKKLLTVLLIAVMVMGLAACGGGAAGTVGETLVADFKADATGTPQEIADRLIQNEIIEFAGATMPVEPGFLTGLTTKSFHSALTSILLTSPPCSIAT